MSTEMCPVESPAWPGAAGFHLRSFLEAGLAGGGVLAGVWSMGSSSRTWELTDLQILTPDWLNQKRWPIPVPPEC